MPSLTRSHEQQAGSCPAAQLGSRMAKYRQNNQYQEQNMLTFSITKHSKGLQFHFDSYKARSPWMGNYISLLVQEAQTEGRHKRKVTSK